MIYYSHKTPNINSYSGFYYLFTAMNYTFLLNVTNPSSVFLFLWVSDYNNERATKGNTNQWPVQDSAEPSHHRTIVRQSLSKGRQCSWTDSMRPGIFHGASIIIQAEEPRLWATGACFHFLFLSILAVNALAIGTKLIKLAVLGTIRFQRLFLGTSKYPFFLKMAQWSEYCIRCWSNYMLGDAVYLWKYNTGTCWN